MKPKGRKKKSGVSLDGLAPVHGTYRQQPFAFYHNACAKKFATPLPASLASYKLFQAASQYGGAVAVR